ncbi:MAG: YitT family protein [Phycisphaerales bacterium]
MFKSPTPSNHMSRAMVLCGGVLYAIALKYFVLPAGVILTGTEGIAVAFSYYFDRTEIFIILYAVFQFALLTFAYLKISRTFARRSLMVVMSVIIGLIVLPDIQFAQPEPQNERIILVLFGGLLAGVAKAIAFKNRGSTGDEDIIAAYFAMKYLRPVGSIAVLAAVVSTAFGLSMALLKGDPFPVLVNTLMYTCLYIFASAETLNNLYHKFTLTMLVLITDAPEGIGRIIKRTSPHRTFTVQSGVGGHTSTPFSMVRTIVTLEELPKLLYNINQDAPDTFYYYHEVKGISGKYFISPMG